MKKFMPLFFLLLHLLISGCSKQPVNTTPSVNEDIILNDVSFGTDEAQKMDVYLPKNRTAQTKVIIFIHGGGWYMGDKREIKEGAVYFQQQGFTFISINYRLTRTLQRNIHPAQIEDIDKAVNTIIAKSKEWNVSDSKLVFWGGSAGSHLSMLYAYKYNNSKKIKAVISTSGPADLTDTTFISSSIGGLAVEDMITDYIGYSFSANPQAWHDASPVNYINATSVPSMFIHGTADSTVPFHQSEAAFKKLQNLGLPAILKPLPDIGHSLEGVNWAELLALIIQFINSYAQ